MKMTMEPPQPQVLASNLDAMPQDLIGQARWMGWRYEWNGKRWDKTPKTTSGTNANSQDPGTWTDFDSMLLAYACGELDGLGFALGKRADGMCLVGVDFDSCIENGQLADWAAPFVTELSGTYGETSPSGEGIKAFFLCDLQDVEAVRPAFGMDKTWGRKITFGDNGQKHGPAIEWYFSGRYFTVTGLHHEAFGRRLATLDRDTLLRIAALLPEKGKHESAGRDTSRSGTAFHIGLQAHREGKTFDGMCAAIAKDPRTAAWHDEKGVINERRELRRIWDKALATVVASDHTPLLTAREFVRRNFTKKGMRSRGVLDQFGELKRPIVWDLGLSCPDGAWPIG
jgi:hypothetical protein